MEYRRLGQAGIRVSEVSVGGWLTQGRSITDDTTAVIVKRAFDLGINFFDSADVYNSGKAEIALGKAIKGFRRADLVLATKCFFPMTDRPNDQGNSRKHIFESVHASLERLGSDYIDLMQCHRFDPHTPVDETVRAMDDLIRQGKVLYWGVSMWPAHEIVNACAIAERLGCRPPSSNQPVYSMLVREVEGNVMIACEKHGLGLVVFSPLAQGVLTGKYQPGQPPPKGSRAADKESSMFMGRHLEDEVLQKVAKLGEFAKKHDCTLAQFALAWCLRHSVVSSVIVGATSPEQVVANAASGVRFESSVWEEAEAILAP